MKNQRIIQKFYNNNNLILIQVLKFNNCFNNNSKKESTIRLSK